MWHYSYSDSRVLEFMKTYCAAFENLRVLQLTNILVGETRNFYCLFVVWPLPTLLSRVPCYRHSGQFRALHGLLALVSMLFCHSVMVTRSYTRYFVT